MFNFEYSNWVFKFLLLLLLRFQQDVRVVRPVHDHVLLQEQAHDDRSRHRKQQQDQLGHGGQAGILIGEPD